MSGSFLAVAETGKLYYDFFHKVMEEYKTVMSRRSSIERK